MDKRHSEAIGRLKIQYGTSMAYPLSSMGAHVSSIPNHQVGRTAPLQTISNAAYFGVFGYELDPWALSEEECKVIKEQIKVYKRHRRLITQGTFYRLLSPFEKNETAWMAIDAKREHALVGWYQLLSRPNEVCLRLKLVGLDEMAVYFVEELGQRFTDSELINIGLTLTPPHKTGQDFNIAEKYDFSSQLFTLTKEISSSWIMTLRIRSKTRSLLQLLRISGAHQSDLRGCAVNITHIFGCELNVHCA